MKDFVRGPRLWRVLTLLCVWLAVVQSVAAQESPGAGKVRVQVVLRDTSDHLRVFYQGQGAFAGNVLVPFFRIGNLVRQDERGDRLTAAVGDYPRGKVLAEAFERVFPRKYPVFEVHALEEGSKHLSDAELCRAAKAAGFGYLILVDESFAGLWSGALIAQDETVSAVLEAKVEVFDVSTPKPVYTRGLQANSLVRMPLQSAMASGDYFKGQFPALSETLAGIVVGELLRTDRLHGMAASVGRGDEVPALAGVLGRYGGAIRRSPKAPSGWRVVDLKTPYAVVIEPKSMLRMKMGVRYDVDLLISEFGQDVGSIEEYLTAVADRYTEAGFDLATLAPYRAEGSIQLPGYTAYSMRRKDGTGGQIMYFRMLEKPYLAMKIVVAIEDMDGLVAANRAGIEQALASSEITIAR